MPAHACRECKVNWPACVVRPGPVMEARCRCPVCGELCAILHSAEPLEPSAAKHLIFDDYWAKWEKARLAAQEAELADLPTAA